MKSIFSAFIALSLSAQVFGARGNAKAHYLDTLSYCERVTVESAPNVQLGCASNICDQYNSCCKLSNGQAFASRVENGMRLPGDGQCLTAMPFSAATYNHGRFTEHTSCPSGNYGKDGKCCQDGVTANGFARSAGGRIISGQGFCEKVYRK